jgi:hypothetical protein
VARLRRAKACIGHIAAKHLDSPVLDAILFTVVLTLRKTIGAMA